MSVLIRLRYIFFVVVHNDDWYWLDERVILSGLAATTALLAMSVFYPVCANLAGMTAGLTGAGVFVYNWMRTCERCKSVTGVEMITAMTAYHWRGNGKNPNRPMRLCLDCADEYHEHWQAMWDDYYSSRL